MIFRMLLFIFLLPPYFTYSQIVDFPKEDLIRYTPNEQYERDDYGRVIVPDEKLEALKDISVGIAWGVLRKEGYERQFVGDFKILHPGKRIVGRAVTAQFLPDRPDVKQIHQEQSEERGLVKGDAQKVIDLLEKGDVPVVDMMGGGDGRTFGGDNLHAAIYGLTGVGAVIDGRIRDLQGCHELPTQIYYREASAVSVKNVVLMGVNIPVKIGDALVMPGDVVFADRTGIVFIPPQFVDKIIAKKDGLMIFDEWTKEKFLTGKYKASELYGGEKSPELQAEYDAYAKKKKAELEQKRKKN
ncbi:MAG: hypothetical protein KI786_02085 [Mameliella sp.]|nr:hypothetical protein [Phaeodactylibacter sp.]